MFLTNPTKLGCCDVRLPVTWGRGLVWRRGLFGGEEWGRCRRPLLPCVTAYYDHSSLKHPSISFLFYRLKIVP